MIAALLGSEDGLVGAFLVCLLGSLLCQARLHVYPVPSATKTRLQQWLSLQRWYRGKGDVFWTFSSKIIRLLIQISELIALVMTVPAVVLEQWDWAGIGTERPLNVISQHSIAQMTSPFPTPSLLPRVWCPSYYLAKVDMPSVLKHFASCRSVLNIQFSLSSIILLKLKPLSSNCNRCLGAGW